MSIYVPVLPKRIADAPCQICWQGAGFQGVLVSVLTVFAFNRSAEILGPLPAATLTALIPLATLLIGAIALHEQAGEPRISRL